MASSDRQRATARPSSPDALLTIDPIDSTSSFDAVEPLDVPAAPPVERDDREAFVHPPARRRTQPPVNVSAEDFDPIDYAESTSYTSRSHQPLSGAGYRRSRHHAERMKRNLRYGQYLEVPKGQRDIFSPQDRRRSATIALVVALALVIAAVVLAILLWPR